MKKYIDSDYKKQLKTNEGISILKSKIAQRFSLYIAGFGLLLALIISSFSIYYEYRDDVSNLNKELMQVEQSIKNSLSQNLWQMNFNGLNILTNDLLMDRDIVYIELFDEKGNLLIKKGNKARKNIIEKSIPIYHQYNGRKIYLGKLDYIATRAHIIEKIKKTALGIIFPIIIFFALLSIAIILLSWHFIVKHLLTIKDYTDKLHIDGYQGLEIDDLSLERSSDNNSNGGDELTQVVNVINKMHHEIVEKYTDIKFQSLHDALTGLPNRRMIDQIIENLTKHNLDTDKYCALLYIDLDQFKLLNESMGHRVGDKILIKIANRMRTIKGKDFQVTRVAGDEFLIIQSKIAAKKEEAKEVAMKFAQQILSTISENLVIDNNNFKITACIGITLFGIEANTEVIIKQADNALYRAKEQGRGKIVFFVPNMQKLTDRRLQVEQLIEGAIRKDLLFINYQPKYNNQQKIFSAEALVRLRDEDGNIVSPAEFIPITEETGAIIEIGDHIIKKVFNFIRKHRFDIERSGIKSIAINVSPTQYSSKGFADRVIAFAREYDIDPHFVILEITEEVIASSIDSVLDVMRKLKKYGFSFSIDDFGTGYSSLRYLKNLPLDELKIDKSFIDDIIEDKRAAGIVKTIIDMAHNLKLKVVAEGVENKEQLDILHLQGCELYQGFIFSKPLVENEFLDKLKTNNK